jgi:hypothetical protein
MDPARLRLMQAVEHVLTKRRPDRAEIERLKDYARTEVPNSADLDDDELATVVALRLMNVTREQVLRLTTE